MASTHRPLHEKHGSKLGKQDDQSNVIEIVEAYLAAMKAGKITVSHIGEIDTGNGVFIRTFVADESKNK